MPTETPDVKKFLGAQMMTLRVLWVSFLFATFVMGAVVFAVPIEAVDPASPLPLLLGVLSLTEAGAAFFMRWKLMGSVGLVAPSDLRVDESLKGQTLLDEVNGAMNRYRLGSIIGFAFAESIAVFGIVAGFITGQPLWYAPFGCFALLLLLVQVPRVGGLRALLSDAGRKGLSRAMER